MSTKNFTGSDKAAAAIGSLLVAAVIGFAVTKEMGMIDNLLAKRGVGLALGGLLIVAGNLLPKLVLPLGARGGHGEKAAAAERFAGLVFVLAGLVQVMVWVFAPLNAPLVASLVGLTAVALAAANYIGLAMKGPARGLFAETPPQTRADRALLSKRGIVFQILYALVWVFAMFLADEIWGDQFSQWMAVAFVLTQGILVALLVRQRRGLQTPQG